MPQDTPGSRNHPAQIGRYEILETVGAGGMGTVYKARHLDLHREVALKVLPPELAVRTDMLDRFRLEAQHAAKLRHENIVTLYEFGESAGLHFLAMEFVAGQNLHEYINRKGQLQPDEARRISIQAARALILAHQLGIVHRDIKPSNFLLAQRDGRLVVKLTDFGLARTADDQDYKVTKTGTTVGTVDYIAPEQARDSHAADIRSDIYSLGCTLYHMLAGRPPFPEGDLTERLLKHVEATPEDVKKFNADVSPGLAFVLSKMIAKKPADRYQTPAELLKDLERPPRIQTRDPRELLEALAPEKPVKPRSAPAAKAKERHDMQPELQREPSSVELRYRNQQIAAKPRKHRGRSIEDHSRGLMSVTGWKAWTAILSVSVLVLGGLLAVLFGWGANQGGRKVRPSPALPGPGEAAKVDSKSTALAKVSETSKGGTDGVKPPDDGKTAGRTVGDPRLRPVYTPTPEQRLRLEQQFEQHRTVALHKEFRYSRPDASGSQAQGMHNPFAPLRGRPGDPSPGGSTTKVGAPTQAKGGPQVGDAAGKGQSTPIEPVKSKTKVSQPNIPNITTTPSGTAAGSGSSPRIYRVSRQPMMDSLPAFTSLADACRHIGSLPPAESIIEVWDNGPLFEPAMTIRDRRLVIRAAAGFRPLIAWDLQSAEHGQASHLLTITGGGLVLENLDFVLSCNDATLPRAAGILRAGQANVLIDGCSFSVAGRPSGEGGCLLFDDGSGPDAAGTRPPEQRPAGCRISRSYFRAADGVLCNIRGGRLDLLVQDSLLVSGRQPVVKVGTVANSSVQIHALRCTLVAGPVLFAVEGLEPSKSSSTAIEWLAWDTLFARHAASQSGTLIRFGPNVDSRCLKWRATNCLYSGWSKLLQSSREVVSAGDETAWQQWGNPDGGDKVEPRAWPEYVPADLADAPAAAFTVQGTHARHGASSTAGTLGCDVAAVPTGRLGWLAYTYGPLALPNIEVPANDQAPQIPQVDDGNYHGERLRPGGMMDLGAYLQDRRAKQQFASRVVICLQGNGVVPTSPIVVKDCHLVIYSEQSKQGEPLVLTPRGGGDSPALIQVENGSLTLLGVRIRFPSPASYAVPERMISVRGGNCTLVGCWLQGVLAQPPEYFSGLIAFEGIGGEQDTMPECLIADSILLSARPCVTVHGQSARLRLRNCVVVSGAEAVLLRPGAVQGRSGMQCILDHVTAAVGGACVRIGDIPNAPGPGQPAYLDVRNSAILAPLEPPQNPAGLIQYDGAALAHGLIVWQGYRNVYDRRLRYFALPAVHPLPEPGQSRDVLRKIWGAACDRQGADLVQVDTMRIQLARPSLDKLALPAGLPAAGGDQPGASSELLQKPK